MGRYYILRDGEVFEEPEHTEWSRWYESEYASVERVAHTELAHGVVTTRFLALNMTLSRDERAQVFETRIRGGWLDDQWERYPTLEEARAGHETWVARVRAAEEENQLPPPGATW